MTPEEVKSRGWDAVDVVFVSGDAYVDHPSFAMGPAGPAPGERRLSGGDPQPARLALVRGVAAVFGRPRVCYAVSAGNMDSMLNHYTAARKVA